MSKIQVLIIIFNTPPTHEEEYAFDLLKSIFLGPEGQGAGEDHSFKEEEGEAWGTMVKTLEPEKLQKLIESMVERNWTDLKESITEMNFEDWARNINSFVEKVSGSCIQSAPSL